MVSLAAGTMLRRLLPSPLHQRLVAVHAEDALRRSSIFQVFDLLLTIPTSKTGSAESLVAREDGKILDLVSARAAAVRAVIANERTVTKQEEVGVRVEEGPTGVASETVYVPSVARCQMFSIVTPNAYCHGRMKEAYQVRRPFPRQESIRA